MKVVINKCYGGFSISKVCAECMAKLGDIEAQAELDDFKKEQDCIDFYFKNGIFPEDCKDKESLMTTVKYRNTATFYGFGYSDKADGYSRTNENLIKCIEDLGEQANGDHSSLEIVDIPDDIEYIIDDYDGIETIHEQHRSW